MGGDPRAALGQLKNLNDVGIISDRHYASAYNTITAPNKQAWSLPTYDAIGDQIDAYDPTMDLYGDREEYLKSMITASNLPTGDQKALWERVQDAKRLSEADETNAAYKAGQELLDEYQENFMLGTRDLGTDAENKAIKIYEEIKMPGGRDPKMVLRPEFLESRQKMRSHLSDKLRAYMKKNPEATEEEVRGKVNEWFSTARHLRAAGQDFPVDRSMDYYREGIDLARKMESEYMAKIADEGPTEEQMEQLKTQSSVFDPQSSRYDYHGAVAAGLKRDSKKHWHSRDPETGMILKGVNHETFHETFDGETSKKVGNRFYYRPSTRRYYSLKESEAEYGDVDVTEDLRKIRDKQAPKKKAYLDAGWKSLEQSQQNLKKKEEAKKKADPDWRKTYVKPSKAPKKEHKPFTSIKLSQEFIDKVKKPASEQTGKEFMDEVFNRLEKELGRSLTKEEKQLVREEAMRLELDESMRKSLDKTADKLAE
jgi:hypothetical protein